MASPVRRNCRKRCMGCDPCWICRFSYPSYITISSHPDAVRDVSATTGWKGCLGVSTGTFVPALPFGTPAFTNEVATHYTFRTPIPGPSGILSPNPCSAQWRLAITNFTQGEYLQFGEWIPIRANNIGQFAGDVPTTAVARCTGDDSIAWDRGGVTIKRETFGAIEYLQQSIVSVGVGAVTGPLLAPTTRASSLGSTTIVVAFLEVLMGYYRASGVSGEYNVTRIERHELVLDKPCQRVGTFDAQFVSRSLSGGPIFGTLPVPAGVTTATPQYQVTVTL
jgi:hypothetical protein